MKTVNEIVNYLENEMKKNREIFNETCIRQYQSSDDDYKEWCNRLMDDCITRNIELQKVLQFIKG